MEQQNALEAAAVEVDRAIAVLRERAVAMMQCQKQLNSQVWDIASENQLLAIANLSVSIRNAIVTACTTCPACKQPETLKATEQ